jgi:hypothetical protein
MADPVRELKVYGRDVLGMAICRLPTSLRKAAFLCVNTYTSYRLALGTGAIHDAVNLAKVLKDLGFEIFFLHNPHVRNFLKYLDVFFRVTSDTLLLYYVGRGMSLRAPGAETSEPRDQAFVFDDGILADDDLATHLVTHKNAASQLILITDACFSGTIWDIEDGCVKGKQFPPNIISLSARVNLASGKCQTIERTDQGVVTLNLAKIVQAEPELSPKEIADKMQDALRESGQTFTAVSTSPELLTQPLFQKPLI